MFLRVPRSYLACTGRIHADHAHLRQHGPSAVCHLASKLINMNSATGWQGSSAAAVGLLCHLHATDDAGWRRQHARRRRGHANWRPACQEAAPWPRLYRFCRACPVCRCWCPPGRAPWSVECMPVMCLSMSSCRGNAGQIFSTPCSAQNLIHRHPGRIQTKYLAVTRDFSRNRRSVPDLGPENLDAAERG